MPPQRTPSGKGRFRLGPAETDSATKRLLAARARQASARPSVPVPVPEAPEETAEAEETSAPPEVDIDDTGTTRPRLLLPVLLGVLTIILGSLAAWFGAEAASVNGSSAAQNSALTNATMTTEVSREIAAEVGSLFSYNYADPGPTTAAANQYLTGAAVAQYAAQFATVRTDAPKYQLIVSTSVTNVGVEFLTGNTARLLVFAIESDRRATSAKSDGASTMLAVNAIFQGGNWKIEGLDVYGS
jgi:Mce-associated membrane protein